MANEYGTSLDTAFRAVFGSTPAEYRRIRVKAAMADAFDRLAPVELVPWDEEEDA